MFGFMKDKNQSLTRMRKVKDDTPLARANESTPTRYKVLVDSVTASVPFQIISVSDLSAIFLTKSAVKEAREGTKVMKNLPFKVITFLTWKDQSALSFMNRFL